jgi:hypothetical protein
MNTIENENGRSSFNACEFFDCADSEVLTWSSPVEAIRHFIGDFLSPDTTPEEVRAAVVQRCPLVVSGYAREQVDEARRRAFVSALCAKLLEDYEEEYGDPRGESKFISDAALTEVRRLMRVAVDRFCESARAWPCRKVAERSYSVEEIMEIMRHRQ